MILIDSSAIIEFLRGDTALQKFISAQREPVFTSEVVVYELFCGLYKTPNKKQQKRTETFLQVVPVLPFSKYCGKTTAQLEMKLKSKGLEIGQNDCMIAATALVNGCSKIITLNGKHFARIPGLEVISY